MHLSNAYSIENLIYVKTCTPPLSKSLYFLFLSVVECWADIEEGVHLESNGRQSLVGNSEEPSLRGNPRV